MTAARSVLFVHPADEAYGADRILLLAADGLLARGWTVRVLLPDDVAPGWLSAQLTSRGIETRRGPLGAARRRYFTPTGVPRYIAELARARRFVRRAAGRWAPSVIHVNTTALLVGAILGRPGGARLVWHVHEIVVRPRAIATLFRVAPLATADRVIAVSDAVSRWLGAVPFRRGRVTTIRNGIPHRPVDRAGRGDRPRVAYVGRLNRWKGYEVFIDAVALLGARFPEVDFLVVGDPPPGEEWRRDDLDRMIAAAGIADRVEVLGFCDDVPALLDTVDIVAVPSTWPDPLPTIVLEAMRAGCAVVASDHGGAPEMIEDSRSGVLVPPGDAAALADAVAALLRDDDRRVQMGERAAERVASVFGVDRFVGDLVTVYDEVAR